MGNLAVTYQYIADILSYKTPYPKLENSLSNPLFNWDAIVIEGSKHLVLPAIYCRLKSKQLLHLLPKELITYLEEITSINRNRNEAILKQSQSISQIFNEHNIDHVFLKGSALLALGCFTDNAERMIGDIDILVSLNQLDKAYNLLQINGYTPIEQTFGYELFEHKHLPRLKPNHQICAVELHRKLFVSNSYKELRAQDILDKKVSLSNIYIPSKSHLLTHNILNFQINDKGALYNSISFRSAYDTIVLLSDSNVEKTWYSHKIIKSYLCFTSLFFKDTQITTKCTSNFSTYFYLFKLKHIWFYKFWNNLLKLRSITPVLLNRIFLFISNKTYRKAVINDRKRIYRYLQTIFSNS